MAYEDVKTCIDACHKCAESCDHCTVSCLNEKDIEAMRQCIKLNLDAAAIARLAASYMANDSLFIKDMCGLCAKVCQACSRECARHAVAYCQECAAACRECAQACKSVAGGFQSTQPEAAFV